MSREFFETVIYRSDESAGIRWMAGICLAIFLMPLLGSVGSAIVGFMGISAIPYFFYRQISYTAEEKKICLIVLVYLGLNLAGALLHDNHMEGLSDALSNSGFLCLIVLLPVLRTAKMPDLEINLTRVFVAASLITMLAAYAEIRFTGHHRAELKSSNSLMLSYMAGSNGLMCLVFALNNRGMKMALCLTGLAASLVTLILAGSKGPIIAMALGILVVFAYRAGRNPKKLLSLTAMATLAALLFATTIYLARDTPMFSGLYERFDKTLTTMEKGEYQDPESSTAIRVVYTKAALKLIADHPLIGVGRQNIMVEASRYAPNPQKGWFTLSHLHNAFLTEFAAYGFLGAIIFAAMLAIPLLAARKGRNIHREAAITFSLYSALCFFFNIGFYNDITVFFFVIMTLTLNAWAAQNRQATNSPSNR